MGETLNCLFFFLPSFFFFHIWCSLLFLQKYILAPFGWPSPSSYLPCLLSPPCGLINPGLCAGTVNPRFPSGFLCVASFSPQTPQLFPMNSHSRFPGWESMSHLVSPGLRSYQSSCPARPTGGAKIIRAVYLSLVIVKCPWPRWAWLRRGSPPATKQWAGGLGKSNLHENTLSCWLAAIVWIQCYNYSYNEFSYSKKHQNLLK